MTQLKLKGNKKDISADGKRRQGVMKYEHIRNTFLPFTKSIWHNFVSLEPAANAFFR